MNSWRDDQIEAEIAKPPSLRESYLMGRECGSTGPNRENTKLKYQATPAHRKAYQQGKRDSYER